MVSNVMKWPIQDIDVPDKWSSNSRKMLLVGDAAHAMVPFMALGKANTNITKATPYTYY